MLFNSVEFLFFLPIVVSIYFFIPYRYRWVLLLIASYYFYMSWNPTYVFLIIFSTLVDYIVAILISQCRNKRKKKLLLLASIFTNLGILFFFKYFTFFNESLTYVTALIGINFNTPHLSILLPVGISFYTFQTLSYTIDVYKGKISPEKHFGIFAVYVSFFPQLIAGPIERASNLLPQFFEKHKFDFTRIRDGLLLILWGFFKKIVVADRLATFVNPVYDNPYIFNAPSLLIATFFFSFQIYCDFSAYSDIAIGSAKIMGFDLVKNFRRPYHAQTISEFWQRWHISLYRWFMDYIYIPLGGSRVGTSRHYFNILIVFLISGLWHGANWTFIFWGTLHGFYLILAQIKEKIKFFSLSKPLKIFLTFSIVNFAWIFFRAESMHEAMIIVKKVMYFDLSGMNIFSLDKLSFLIAIWSIIFLESIYFLDKKINILKKVKATNPVLRWSIYYTLIIVILVLGEFRQQAFIYFQF